MADLNTSISLSCDVEDGGKSANDWTEVLNKEINRKKIPGMKTSLGEGISTESRVKRQ